MCDYETLRAGRHGLVERCDDGRTIIHVGDLSPRCGDCRTGTLQWAEAGYVPWHRICDGCGAHRDLHPIVWWLTWGEDGPELIDDLAMPRYPASQYVRDKALALVLSGRVGGRVERQRGTWRVDGDHGVYTVTLRRGEWTCTCPAEATCSHIVAARMAEDGTVYRLGARSLVTWDHVREALARVEPGGPEAGGAPHIDGCWARRARFYRR
jgi:hypothetical protein